MTLSGGFSLTGPFMLEYLVVAAGGGGGAGSNRFSPGGGGGGGEVIYNTSSGDNLLSAGTITIVVGAGGAAGSAVNPPSDSPTRTNGTAGSNSSITINGTAITANAGNYGNNWFLASVSYVVWGGTSGTGNPGGLGRSNNGQGSSGGGAATAGFGLDDSLYPSQGGWGTKVTFDTYGTNANNAGSSFTISVLSLSTGGKFNNITPTTPLAVGMAVTISGTKGGTGTITGYTNPTTYYIIATGAGYQGAPYFNLSATLGGSAITTTSGTPTGLTYTVAASTTRGYFGGGGGAGNWSAYGPVTGGRGGGGVAPNGRDAATSIGYSGSINTGGGGGAGGGTYNTSNTYNNGGAGGSGIVIIRYPDRGYPTPSTTGSPTITSGNGAITYTFTSSGSLTF